MSQQFSLTKHGKHHSFTTTFFPAESKYNLRVLLNTMIQAAYSNCWQMNLKLESRIVGKF